MVILFTFFPGERLVVWFWLEHSFFYFYFYFLCVIIDGFVRGGEVGENLDGDLVESGLAGVSVAEFSLIFEFFFSIVVRAVPDRDGGRSRGLYSFGASVLEGVGVGMWVYGVCVWCLMFETMLRLRYYAR